MSKSIKILIAVLLGIAGVALLLGISELNRYGGGMPGAILIGSSIVTVAWVIHFIQKRGNSAIR